MTAPTTTIPTWASDSTFSTGVDAGVTTKLEPQPEEIAQGVRAGKFAARKFNWLIRTITDWLAYFRDSCANLIDGGTYYRATSRTVSVTGPFAMNFGDGSSNQSVAMNCPLSCTKPASFSKGITLGYAVLSATADTLLYDLPMLVTNSENGPLTGNRKLRLQPGIANGFFWLHLVAQPGTRRTLIVADENNVNQFLISEKTVSQSFLIRVMYNLPIAVEIALDGQA